MKQAVAFEIQTTQLHLQDLPINLDQVTELEDSSVFKLVRMAPEPYEVEGETFIFMTGIQMNLDQTLIARTGYTFLDVLSDVGGLESIVISTVAIVIQIWNHNRFDTYLASNLFTTRAAPSSGATMEPERFSASEISGLRECLLDSCFGNWLFKCCKRSRRHETI